MASGHVCRASAGEKDSKDYERISDRYFRLATSYSYSWPNGSIMTETWVQYDSQCRDISSQNCLVLFQSSNVTSRDFVAMMLREGGRRDTNAWVKGIAGLDNVREKSDEIESIGGGPSERRVFHFSNSGRALAGHPREISSALRRDVSWKRAAVGKPHRKPVRNFVHFTYRDKSNVLRNRLSP